MRWCHGLFGLVALGFAAMPLSAQARPSSAWRFAAAIGSGLPVGALGNARTTWQGNSRFNFRGEVTVAQFVSRESDAVFAPCPMICPPLPELSQPTNIGGLSAHLIVNGDQITRGEDGSYYILGGGMYRDLSPSRVGSIGGAFEGGLGFRFGDGSLEVKYVRSPHWIGGRFEFLPITLGYSF